MTSANIDKRLLAQNRLVKEVSGWPAAHRAYATLSADVFTRVFKITPAISPGAATYYIHGIPRDVAFPVSKSVTWNDTEGTWFFYIDTTGTLVATQDATLWEAAILGDGVTVATLYWDVTNQTRFAFCEERHGFMQGDIHLEMHNAFGTQWVSGGNLTDLIVNGDGSIPTHAQLGVGSVKIYDEDLRFNYTDGAPQTLTAPATLPVYYRSGANGYWRRKNPDVYPFIYQGTAGYSGANGRVPYNNQNAGGAGIWGLTQLTDQDFVLIHIYATNDIEFPIIAVQGQTQYTTLTAAQTGAATELLGLSTAVKTLSIEATPLGSLVLQTRNTYANAPKARWQPATAAGASYADFRGSTFRGGVSSGVTVHSQLSGLASDDHGQYALLAGRAGGQALVGGTAASEKLQLSSTAHATKGLVESLDGFTASFIVTPTALAAGGTAGFIRTTDNDFICVTKNASTEYAWLYTDTTLNGGGPILGAPTLYRTTLQASTVVSVNIFGSTVFQFTGTGLNLYQKRLQGLPLPSATDDAAPRIYVDQPVVISPTQLTANQNDYNPTGFDGAFVLRLSSDASRDITGFVYTSGNYPVLRKQVTNFGTYPIVLKHYSASSAVANRIFCTSGTDFTLYSGESVTIWYDATSQGWRLTASGVKNAGGAVDATYLPEVAPTLVHLHFDSSIADVSPFPQTFTTVGTPTYDTGDKKWGSASFNVNDSKVYAYADLNGAFDFGLDDFTIEWWAKVNAVSAYGGGRNIFLYFSDTAGNDQQGPLLFIETSQVFNMLTCDYGVGGWDNVVPYHSSMATLGYGTWRHFAAWRWNGMYFVGIDGIVTTLGGFRSALPVHTGQRLFVARHSPGGGLDGTLNGRIDEIHIRRGAPYRYSDYTVPTRAFYDSTNLPSGNYGEMRVDGNGGAFICHGGTKWKKLQSV